MEDHFQTRQELIYLFEKLYNRVDEESNKQFGYNADQMLLKNRLKALKKELENINDKLKEL